MIQEQNLRGMGGKERNSHDLSKPTFSPKSTLRRHLKDRLSAPPNDLAAIPPTALQRQKAASGAIPAGKGRAGGSTR